MVKVYNNLALLYMMYFYFSCTISTFFVKSTINLLINCPSLARITLKHARKAATCMSAFPVTKSTIVRTILFGFLITIPLAFILCMASEV